MPGAPDLFPVFLKLDDRPVLVVGGGAVAASKLAALQSTGARITVVAPAISEAVRTAGVVCHERMFEPTDLEGQWLVVAAATPDVNRDVARHAADHRLFVNAVDDPANATAYLGGVLRREGVTIAISTDGRAPALAGLLREGLDALLPRDLGEWLERSDELKRTWRSERVPMDERRPQLMEALMRLYEHRRSAAQAGPETIVSAARRPSGPGGAACAGFVSLVGAGPGDPELLTWRAIQRLRAADLVLYDGLVPDAVVRLAETAEHVSVARRAGAKTLTQDDVSARMVKEAWEGRRVVRLKAGDPFVFARGGEEAAALTDAGVPFDVVPGVTSAMAAPALAGIPVTHRDVASAFIVLTGHAEAVYGPILGRLAPDSVTVVVLMGGAERAGIRRTLEQAGWSSETAAAIVTRASQPGQQVWTGTLGALDTMPASASADDPGVIIIGRVVSLATAQSRQATADGSVLTLPFVSEETPWQPSTIPRR